MVHSRQKCGEYMLKVIIVDDEVLALEYLRNMIDWKANGFDLIGEAHNGKRALELCRSKSVDVVISDIKMPLMDGIELAKELKQMNGSIKVILVSAYKDFDYAKSAIQYEVSNYLIKHELSIETLLSELEKVKESIASEAKLNLSHREYLVKNLIYSVGKEQYIEVSSLAEFGTHFVMMMLKNNTLLFNVDQKESDAYNSSLLLNTLVESMRGLSYGSLEYLTDFQISEEHVLVLFGIKDIYSELRIKNEIQKAIGKIYEMGDNKDFASLRILSSQKIHLDILSKTFRQLAEGIRYSGFMDYGRYYFMEELPIDSENKTDASSKKINEEVIKSLEMIEEKINKENVSVIEKLFESVKMPYWYLEGLKLLTQKLNQFIMLNDRSLLKKLSDRSSSYKNYSDVVDAYVGCVQQIIDKKEELNYQGYSLIITQVIEFIKNHYAEKLTLDMIGDIFELNGVYLGQLFKKEVNMTFLKYLTHYRMELSKDMLINTRMSVGEISEKVGYTTSQYFSQIFTKNIGVTPQDYRKWGDKGEKTKA